MVQTRLGAIVNTLAWLKYRVLKTSIRDTVIHRFISDSLYKTFENSPITDSGPYNPMCPLVQKTL